MPRAPILALLLTACAPAGPQGATLPQPGEWEVTGTVQSLTLPGVPEKDRAAMVRAMQPGSHRECQQARVHKIGDKTLDGLCTITRIADAGGKISRTEDCGSIKPGTKDTIETSGTQGPDAYALRIVTTRRRTDTGELVSAIDILETGRRIGACPTASQQAKPQ